MPLLCPVSVQEIGHLIRTVEVRRQTQCLENSQQGLLENKLDQFLFFLIFCQSTS